MLAAIRDFFTAAIAPGLGGDTRASGHALQLATAALLLEMMRMDGSLDPRERESAVAALRRCFSLSAAEIDALLQLAEAEARQATDYYQFTALLNKACSREEKSVIIENLWRVAYADGHLDAHEQHLMRKLADLLYVSQGDYLEAKRRAREIATGA